MEYDTPQAWHALVPACLLEPVATQLPLAPTAQPDNSSNSIYQVLI